MPLLRRGDPRRRDQVPVLLQRPPSRHRHRDAATASATWSLGRGLTLAAGPSTLPEPPERRRPRHRPLVRRSTRTRDSATYSGFVADSFGIWDRQSPGAPRRDVPAHRRRVAERLDPLRQSRTQSSAGGSGGQQPVATPIVAEHAQRTRLRLRTRRITRSSNTRIRVRTTCWDTGGRSSGSGFGRIRRRPLERFPRDDAGWAAAWRRFTTIESNYAEVGLGSSGSA